MNKTTVSKMIFGAVLLLFTACTQDELAEQGNTLPDGEYPLQIGSVSIIAESSEEPWTRVTEKPDGSGSVWQPDDAITVSLDGETATYTYDGSAWTSDAPLYWKNTQTAEVTAWYPATDGALDLGGQDKGLVYVLRATADNASHNTPVNLQFEHQLAKVRVVTKGTVNVGSISIRYPDLCVVNEGIVTSVGSWLDLDLYKTYYEGIGTCWEINLPVGNDIEFCRVTPIENSAIMKNAPLTPPVTLEASKVHTITITANREGTQTIDLSNGDYTISGDGTYYFSGTASHAIRVTGGNPNIYLEDVQISVSGGNAIDIQGGSPTIHVRGEGNTITSSDKTGIFVAENSTVTITGNGREDKLTVRGGDGSSGIGGYLSREDPAPACGNIEITSVWIEAYGSKSINFEVAPGIGGAGSASCGTITIDDATVYAYGIEAFPIGSSSAIGGGFDIRENKGSFGAITIRNNSEVYVQRGDSYSDYIGNSGSMTYPETGDIVATVDETSTVTKLN